MKLQSMTDFVLQGIDDINKSETPIPDRLIITGYARFLQTELKPEQFDPKNPECLFVGFELRREEETDDLVIESIHSDFYLEWDTEEDMQRDCGNEDISIPTIESFIVFWDNYGYADIELTDYALSKFL